MQKKDFAPDVTFAEQKDLDLLHEKALLSCEKQSKSKFAQHTTTWD